jgi:hypothetical protein
MRMFDNWLRPKWQHPDPDVRLKAVTEEAIDAAGCYALAIGDPEPAVREQAVKRLDSVDQLLEVLDAQPTTRPAVAVRVTSLLLQATAGTLGAQLHPALSALAATPGLAELASQAVDPEIRVAAVARLADQAALRHCALHDRAIDVRVQAVRRIEDEDMLAEIERGARGRDKTVARLAAGRLADIRTGRARTAECEQLLAQLASLAESPELDAEALHRVRARWSELQAHSDARQRARHAELTPGLDARLRALQQAQREDRAKREAREGMLAELQRLESELTSSAPDATRAALNRVRSAWERAPELQDRWTARRLQEEWLERLQRLESRLRQRESSAVQEQLIGAAVAEYETAIEQGAVDAGQLDSARRRLADLSHHNADNPELDRPLQQLRGLVERMSATLTREQDELRTLRGDLKQAIEALETAVRQKRLEPATTAHQKATRLLAEAKGKAEFNPLQRRLAQCEPQLRELRSWRDWGGDKAREELVDEARRLVDAAIGIEQRAQALKKLRARWKALDGGGAKAHRLWVAFDAACTAAHEPIREQRKEQARQRKQNLETRATICAELESLAADTDWSAPDWRALDRRLTETKRRWRDAGGVPHKAWDAIRKRFERALAAVEQHMAKERRHNFLQRQALVEEAQALADSRDLRHATSEARRLRGAWHVTAPSKRREEQALWHAFDCALEAVFDRERAARDEFKAGLEEQRQRAEAICTELQALGKAADRTVADLRHASNRLAGDFARLGPLPRHTRADLENRFHRASTDLQQRIANAEIADARQALLDLHALHEICEQAESLADEPAAAGASAEQLAARWQAATKPGADKGVLAALEQRFADAIAVLDGSTPPADAQTLTRNAALRGEICLDLEILRKLESPADAQAERMQRQVALLEAAMKGGGADQPPETKARRLQLAYLRQGPVPAEERLRLAERFARLFP